MDRTSLERPCRLVNPGLISFDIFDTLLTRGYMRPVDLFLELGARLGEVGSFQGQPKDFQRERAGAEVRARGKVASGEVSLDQIYTELASVMGWDDRSMRRALEMELSLESETLYGVSAMRRRVADERGSQNRIVFISDMYLPSKFLQEILGREGFFSEGDRVFVSCEHGCSKGDGRLYKRVAMELGVDASGWRHYGDHVRSDGVIPRRQGIESVRVDECSPRRAEVAALKIPDPVGLRSSLLAGALRRARLSSADQSEGFRSAFTLGASVAGPILFGFVEWCLTNARSKGLKKLYFVSRDGQILARIARVICAAWDYGLEVCYLYGSRQAWHPAAIDRFSDKEFGWVFAPERYLTLGQVFDRLGLDRDTHSAFWRSRSIGLDVNMASELRREAGQWLLSDPVRSEIERVSLKKRELALLYLRQEGLVGSDDWGMVDIGWAGNLQKSLARLVGGSESGGKKRFWSFYFGLITISVDAGYFPRMSYWNDPGAGGADILSINQAMFEILTAADHGTVTGYQARGSRIEPVLAGQINQAAVDWGLEAFQAGMEACALCLVKALKINRIHPGDYRAFAKEMFASFYASPLREEAELLGSFAFSDQQVESRFDRMTPRWGSWETLLGIVDYRRRPIGWWPEGMVARRFSVPLWSYLFARNAWRQRRGLKSEADRPQDF